MMLNRREMLFAGAGAVAAMTLPAGVLRAADDENKKRLGIVTYSYSARFAADRNRTGDKLFTDPLVFLEYCHSIGAGGIQTNLGKHDTDYCKKFRDSTAAFGMYVEATLGMPKDLNDVERFEVDVRAAKEMGAKVIRTTMLGTRRYETLTDAESFRQFAERSYQSLMYAEPIVAKHQVRLAIENHKDWRIDELLAMLKRISSRYVGVCIDTGNSIALLEDPWEVVDAYAPFATAVHIKDMAVAEYNDGFLLAEVPLGQGFLDMPKLVNRIREAQPDVQFSLEMITRDPLQVPCLTPKYWGTLEKVSGQQLARQLTLVRDKAAKQPLPKISSLSAEEKLKVEDDNVRQCLAYAHEHLSL